VTVASARKYLVTSSLSLTAALFAFFLLAPATGFPLVFDQSLRILQIVLPVFLGYLGSASSFVFRSDSSEDQLAFRRGTSSLASLLTLGPVLAFTIALSALIIAFGVTNRPNAPPGSGISIDQLTTGISIILGLLAVTTSVAVNYLFGGGHNEASGDFNRVVGRAATSGVTADSQGRNLVGSEHRKDSEERSGQ
jgi:hypothetical protein